MATSAQYITQPIVELTQISTANTNRDGTGTITAICSGPSTAAGSGVGKRIIKIHCMTTNTANNGIIRFFYSTDNGTTKRLILEKSVPYTVPSTTVQAFRFEVPELVGLVLPGGNTHQLSASTHNAETWNILVESGLL
jgi:hypothetical protein